MCLSGGRKRKNQAVHVVAKFCTIVKTKILVIQGIRFALLMLVLVSKLLVLKIPTQLHAKKCIQFHMGIEHDWFECIPSVATQTNKGREIISQL